MSDVEFWHSTPRKISLLVSYNREEKKPEGDWMKLAKYAKRR